MDTNEKRPLSEFEKRRRKANHIHEKPSGFGGKRRTDSHHSERRVTENLSVDRNDFKMSDFESLDFEDSTFEHRRTERRTEERHRPEGNSRTEANRRPQTNHRSSQGLTSSQKRKKKRRKYWHMIKKHPRQMMPMFIAVAMVIVLLTSGIVIAKKVANAKEQKRIEIQKAKDAKKRKEQKVVDTAERAAAMYDYDKAIEILTSAKGYDKNEKWQKLVEKYEETKGTLKEWPLDQVTHIFYHTLVYDAKKAFDGDERADGYNQVMTTVDEFNKITQSMYDKGYVMVRLSDIHKLNDDGTMSPGKILLPEGKKPFVLSQDDVSYYHYMDGDGMATKLIIDKNGKIKNEYVEDDGSISVGDYDMVPLIDSFVEKHPDFSYRGAKGILALTGYNGVLGYRTDETYETKEDISIHKQAWLDKHPDFNLEKERKEAKKVADKMKAEGWEFASHTWGHLNAGSQPLSNLKKDAERWKKNVVPVVGETHTIIFAFGSDIGDWKEYSGDKYEFLKSMGFRYFCNVDGSHQYWSQATNQYYRQGRRNLDGYRMYYYPEKLEDLFNVSEVWDKHRPTPVKPM